MLLRTSELMAVYLRDWAYCRVLFDYFWLFRTNLCCR